MKRHVAHWTRWLQGAIVVSIAAAIGWSAVQAGAGKAESTLYITLGELRSRAAEAHELARNAAAERLTGTYVRAQAGQLASRVASLRDDLAKAERDTKSSARTARELAERLLAGLQTLSQRGESVTAAALRDDLASIVAALIPLERQARPA